jgi:hypothetical protein
MVILHSDRQILVQAPAEESSVVCRTPWMDAEVEEDAVNQFLVGCDRTVSRGQEPQLRINARTEKRLRSLELNIRSAVA